MIRSTPDADRLVLPRPGALLLAGALLVALLGCEPADQPPAEEDPTAAFLEGVPPVLEQGVAIAELAEARTDRPEVIELADRTVDRSTDELDQLEELRADADVAPPDEAAAEPDEVADAGLSEQEVTDLARLEGDVFDLAFADALADVHRSVIREATAVGDEAERDELVQLAEEMVGWREADLTQLERWRDEWEADEG